MFTVNAVINNKVSGNLKARACHTCFLSRSYELYMPNRLVCKMKEESTAGVVVLSKRPLFLETEVKSIK